MIPDIQKFITFQQIDTFWKEKCCTFYSFRQKDSLDVTDGPENLNLGQSDFLFD